MLKITDVKLSKNTVATGEKFTISVQIQETVDYPYDYPYDYPISYTGTAKPVNSLRKNEVYESGTGKLYQSNFYGSICFPVGASWSACSAGDPAGGM